jgi:hypothetical protein
MNSEDPFSSSLKICERGSFRKELCKMAEKDIQLIGRDLSLGESGGGGYYECWAIFK